MLPLLVLLLAAGALLYAGVHGLKATTIAERVRAIEWVLIGLVVLMIGVFLLCTG